MNVRDICGVWGKASFGDIYCNAKPNHGTAHRYTNSLGIDFLLSDIEAGRGD